MLRGYTGKYIYIVVILPFLPQGSLADDCSVSLHMQIKIDLLMIDYEYNLIISCLYVKWAWPQILNFTTSWSLANNRSFNVQLLSLFCTFCWFLSFDHSIFSLGNNAVMDIFFLNKQCPVLNQFVAFGNFQPVELNYECPPKKQWPLKYPDYVSFMSHKVCLTDKGL